MGKIPDAIAQASDHTARLVLLALCKENTSVAEKAEHVLNKLAARDKAGKPKIGGEVPLLCWNCQAFYFEEDNYDTACQFHEGELEETEDSYPDTDSWMLNGMDEDELRETFPGEYWWTCCGKQGCEDTSLGPRVALREGCVIQRHMTEEEAGDGSRGSNSNSNSNNKRPATAESDDDGSVKRLAVAAPTAASVVPPSGIKVTPVPVPVLPAASGVKVTPIPPPVLAPTAAGNPAQPTVITLSDDDEDDDDDDDDDDDEE